MYERGVGPHKLENAEQIVEQVIATLRDQRIARGWSQRRLAERAGIDPKTVSLIERGMRSPTLHTLLRIATAMEHPCWPLLRDAEMQNARES